MPQPLCPSEGFSLRLFSSSSTVPLGLYKKKKKINKKRRDPIHQRDCFIRLSDEKRKNAHHCDDMEQRKRVSALHSDCIPCSFSEGIPVLMSHHSSTLPSPWLTTHPAPARRTPGRVASPAPSHPIWRDTRPPTAPRSSRLPKRRHYAWRGFGQRKKPTPPTPPPWLKPLQRFSFPARPAARTGELLLLIPSSLKRAGSSWRAALPLEQLPHAHVTRAELRSGGLRGVPEHRLRPRRGAP